MMMHTMISLQVLKEWGACPPALSAFNHAYGDASVPWTELIKHPECGGGWSCWVRQIVAKYGNAADRAVLRYDPTEWVRYAAERYGEND